MMRRILLLTLMLLHGCTYGLLYTHTTNPLSLNYHRTPVDPGKKTANDSTKQIHIIEVTAKWDTNGIGEIAKKNGFNEIYYADLEIFSVLGGLWEQDYVHIYGK